MPDDAAREIGAAMGIAVAGSVLAAGYTRHIQPTLPQLPEPARGPVADSLAAALEVAAQAGPMAQPLVDSAKEAFVNGSSQATLTLAILTAGAAVLLAFLAPGAAGSRDHKTMASSKAPAHRAVAADK